MQTRWWRSWWCGALLVAGLWAATHLPNLGWGLPSHRSLAPDGLPNGPSASGIAGMMEQQTYKYPPLQYLIWRTVAPPPAERDTDVQAASRRLYRYRLTVSVMTLGTALLVFAFGWQFLRLGMWSTIGAGLFLTTASSLYFAHTTNMDQPYVFWAMVSALLFAVANPAPNGRRYWLGNLGFGVAIGLAFCTKDQVYGLYLLPLAAYLGWRLWRRQTSLGGAVVQGLLWTIPFVIVVASIYAAAGGYDVFRQHLVWIQGPGRANFTQVGPGLLDRLSLEWTSLKCLVVALDWPLTLLLALSAGLVWRRHRQGPLRWLLAASLLLLVAYELSFIQITRFTYDRFYLFFLIPAGLIVAAGMRELRRRWALCLTAALVVAQGLIGLVVTRELPRLPRILVVKNLAAMVAQSDAPPVIGMESLEMGHVYVLTQGQATRRRTMRDWITYRFPYLPFAHRAVHLDPLFLAINAPPVVVAVSDSESTARTMVAAGYEPRYAVAPPRQNRWPSLFQIASQPVTVWIRRFPQAPDDAALSAFSLADQLLTAKAAFPSEVPHDALLNLGRWLKPFDRAQLDDCILDGSSLYLVAIAYDLNDRVLDAANAYLYLLGRYYAPEFEAAWHDFAARRGLNETIR